MRDPARGHRTSPDTPAKRTVTQARWIVQATVRVAAYHRQGFGDIFRRRPSPTVRGNGPLQNDVSRTTASFSAEIAARPGGSPPCTFCLRSNRCTYAPPHPRTHPPPLYSGSPSSCAPTAKYTASGWWKTIADTEASGSIMKPSVSAMPISSGRSRSNSDPLILQRRAGRIAERVALAAVLGAEAVHHRQRRIVRETPLPAQPRVQPLGRRLGRLERQRLHRVALEVLAARPEVGRQLAHARSRRDREQHDIVAARRAPPRPPAARSRPGRVAARRAGAGR